MTICPMTCSLRDATKKELKGITIALEFLPNNSYDATKKELKDELIKELDEYFINAVDATKKELKDIVLENII